MKEYVKSNITGKEYAVQDVVRILNVQQVIGYLKYGITLLDVYPSIDEKTDKPLLVFIFDRNESRIAYDLWCKRELN